jgi:HTH-type transcriptional regulator/antitoxin HipB
MMKPSEENARIGAMVRFHRKKARLTQVELAKFAEVGKTVIFDIEKGKATVKLSTLLRVLRVLNIRLQFSGPLMALFEKGQ